MSELLVLKIALGFFRMISKFLKTIISSIVILIVGLLILRHYHIDGWGIAKGMISQVRRLFG